MNLSFFIAKRYLFSKNNRNAINIISGISVAVVAIATAALIIVLSSINGFAKLINGQIAVYAPDLNITSTKGKTFIIDENAINKIKEITGVKDVVEVVEDNVLIKLEGRQKICRLKGVTDNYVLNTGMNNRLVEGEFLLKDGKYSIGVIGIGIAYELGISVRAQSSFSIWLPNRKFVSVANPMESFITTSILPSGIVSVDNFIDESYIFVSIETARKLMIRKKNEVSSLEIFTYDNANILDIKNEIKTKLGGNFEIKTVYEQFDVYKVMKTERIASFLIMLFIIIVASFSIIGSLTMLIIEKKKDIQTLMSMGAKLSLIKKVFLLEGWLISIIGALIGIFIGGAISYAQELFEIVRFPAEGNYIVSAYPIDIKLSDFIVTFFSVSSVGFLIAIYPLINLGKRLSMFK